VNTLKNWIALSGAVLALAVTAGADDIGKKMVDPVSAKMITVAKETPFVVVNQTRYYFTDAKNREAFLKAPETFLKAPVECPVRGIKGKASKTNRLVVNDQIVYFCCAGCNMGFKKEPNNFLSKLNDPVSGKEFNLVADSPKVEAEGSVYFFETEENKAAFEKEPAKYIKVKLQ
jgi:YHS domain-containing protein